MKKTIVICTAAIGIVAMAWFGYSFWPAKAIPLSIPDLLARQNEPSPSAEFLATQKKVREYRADLKQHADKIEDYIRLAEIYLQESRVTANHHFYVPVASTLIDETLRRDPINFEALVTGAGLKMTLHQFADAEKMVSQAIAQNPYNATSYGVLCDANVELGHYQTAIAACDSMMAKRPDLRSYARASYLRQLTGNDDAAIQAMLMAADAGAFGAENRCWTLYQLANLFFQKGKLDTAAYIYRGILQERPSYAYAHSGLAMVHVARAEYGEAIRELVTATQQLPEHVFLEQLADVYLAMGDTTNAHTLEGRVFTAFDQHEKDGWNIDREYAQFAADHSVRLDEALERAEREWKRRPTNADAIETYAWCKYRSGDANGAASLMERIAAYRIVTPTYHYRAALIFASLDNRTAASSEWNVAQQRVPYTHPALLRDVRTAIGARGLISMK